MREENQIFEVEHDPEMVGKHCRNLCPARLVCELLGDEMTLCFKTFVSLYVTGHCYCSVGMKVMLGNNKRLVLHLKWL